MSTTEEALELLLELGVEAASSSLPQTIDLGNGIGIPTSLVMDAMAMGLKAGMEAIVGAIEERRVDIVAHPDSPGPVLTLVP
jgi:hypothetical protein